MTFGNSNKKPAQGGPSCNGEFLRKPPENHSSAWEDIKFSIAGIAFLIAPIAFLAALFWALFL